MKEKSHITALVLSFFLGIWGIDRFYLGHTKMGIFKLLTVGGFMFIALIDFLRIAIKSDFNISELILLAFLTLKLSKLLL